MVQGCQLLNVVLIKQNLFLKFIIHDFILNDKICIDIMMNNIQKTQYGIIDSQNDRIII